MRVDAPWTDEQVNALNAYQRAAQFHPFTCPHAHDTERELVATTNGWVCRRCGYTQGWAVQTAIEIGQRAAA